MNTGTAMPGAAGGPVATTPRAKRILVVAHRLPLDVQPDALDDAGAWGLSTTEGSHLALYHGLSTQKGLDVCWVGWPGVVVGLQLQPPHREADTSTADTRGPPVERAARLPTGRAGAAGGVV